MQVYFKGDKGMSLKYAGNKDGQKVSVKCE